MKLNIGEKMCKSVTAIFFEDKNLKLNNMNTGYRVTDFFPKKK